MGHLAQLYEWRNWSSKTWLVLILLTASVVTHFIWFGYPTQVVFDEVHFGKFVTAYCCTHQRFFDIHPPHAKLLIAGTAYALGYRGGVSFENIGQDFGSVSTWPLRVFPAITGVLLPLVIYALLRQLKASAAAAFFGGMLVVLDNALTVQTRMIALDGLLLVSTFGALAVYLAARKEMQQYRESPDQNGGQSNWWSRLTGGIRMRREGWMFGLAGGLAGLAVGTKFTGLTAGGLLVLLLGAWLVQIRSWGEIKRWRTAVVFIVLAAIVVYGLGWMIHFMILTEAGDGDLWRKPQWEQPIMASFWRETKAIHKLMYDANSGLKAEHHDASHWWSWPLVQTPVFYWQLSQNEGGVSRSGSIYFLPNPILWWGTSAVFAVILLSMLITGVNNLVRWHGGWQKRVGRMRQQWQQSFLKQAWLPLMGYAASYIPLMKVTRVLFLYHYLTPWLFSLLVVVLWLERIGWIAREEIVDQPKRYWLVLAIILGAFIFFSPLTYGFLLSEVSRSWLFWFKTWL
ncbi:MAG: hypothetical protein A3E37_03065 [Candidatus Andersenbacteria bacterium RIFCSPHIGHO2_12_FULL_46_9]|nr:MAG: Dolichyl-phosphate-mannose-protein mannosyltransferase 4 [Parcubacteria group bacterium GW2011_GWA2_45_14]OGY35516.1 MAG: hypothetical protein A3B76_01945 [Candidatus Andersenbacteria bacterium RIFCSPHIGHO2_02_FULL_46_16]OGY36503.1 MAG: hypothetical protein A3I08_00800 [Candidatus Andersenbacteria bacterium RIFCSPLOWO2_02_FULL_46_11]OGY37699.1 MAG: hypothetical protein A3E37_03065 [Candidatus Andersenbacteria bacterium RIFCSPHIGHO2_12_FULL_46_9]OGY41490.1 MAG: hypothetical protein A3G57